MELVKKDIITFLDVFKYGKQHTYDSNIILKAEFIDKIIEFFRNDSNKKYLIASNNLIIKALFILNIKYTPYLSEFSRLFGFLVKKSIENYETEFKDFFTFTLKEFLNNSRTSIENEENQFFTYKKFNLIYDKIKITEPLIDTFKPLFKSYLQSHGIESMNYKNVPPFKNYTQFIRFISFNNTILDNF